MIWGCTGTALPFPLGEGGLGRGQTMDASGRRLRVETDINQTTTLAESVESDPEREPGQGEFVALQRPNGAFQEAKRGLG